MFPFRPGIPPPFILTVRSRSTKTNTTTTTRHRHHHGLSCRTISLAAPTTRAHRPTTRGDVACCRHRLVIASGGRPPLTALQLTRSKKTRTTVSLEDLPQGTIPLDPRPPSADHGSAGAGAGEEQPTYPTVLQQARRNMQRFASCVLLTRVGGFYELYFEHAEEYGPLLNLKVAQKKTSVGPVSMAGFPFFQLDRFLKILVQDLGKYVAISEEFPNDAPDKAKSGGLMHDRKVARIITPGTLIDENFMDPYANNYVMAVHISEDAASGPEPEPEPEPAGGSQATAPTQATAAVAAVGSRVTMGLAWADVSTGQFFTQAAELSALPSILARVGPREIVLADTLQARPDHDVFAALADDKHVVTYAPSGEILPLEAWAPMLEAELSPDARAAFTHDEVSAGSLLLRYVRDRLLGLDLRLLPPLRHENMHVMTMDKNTLRSLEIKQTMRDGSYRGSLLHAVRRTVTKGGTRLLSEWLGAPSTSLAVIEARQDLVAQFLADEDLRDGVVALLRRTHDSQRLVQKFALGRGVADDLLSLAGTIDASQHVASLLRHASTSLPPTNPEGSSAKAECLAAMADRLQLDEVLKLARRIRDAVDEEGLVQQHQLQDQEQDQMMALAQEVAATRGSDEDIAALPKGAAAAASKKKPQQQKRTTSIRDYYGQDNEAWIMKPDASPVLRELHARLRSLQVDRDALADRLRAELAAPGLTLRWTPGLGHICHVKGKQGTPLKPDADSGLRTLSSSRSTRSFHHPEWTRLGLALDHVRLRVRTEEQVVFRRLREHVVRALVALRRNAAVLDELDVTASFARLARELGLTRPVLVDAPAAHKVLGGRHPTVEAGLGEQAAASSGTGGGGGGGGKALIGAGSRRFVRNDCLVGSPGHGRAWLVTGPNMAGKSTFLRQNALITVLAQVGSYVPADHAELGLVDAIFSRVGSADNLYRDQSTFMVEMLETAHILRTATPRSFVVMDEIGRGTTPEDGAAVAYAALHHLATVTRCRVLFATHFHAVADLAADAGLLRADGSGEVAAYCTDVAEDGAGGFYYVHKLRRGVNRQSHALKVARLAGLPESTIEVARQVLGRLGALAEEERSRRQTTTTVAAMEAKRIR